MMALWRRALLGAGVVAAPRRPARRAAVRAWGFLFFFFLYFDFAVHSKFKF